MTIREALALGPGSIVTLNRLAGEPVDLLVNGKPIARGEVVVIDEEFGLRVTEVLGAEGADDGRRRRRATPRPRDSRYTGGVHRRAARAVAAFWRKAYEDGLTGLAAMVAYNLLLSIFPLALIALFVAGRVLRSPGARGVGHRTTRARSSPPRPRARWSTASAGCSSPRPRSASSPLVSSLWVGASFWGALDTAFCRIYHLPCRTWVRQKLFGFGMLAVVLVFIAASVAVPTVQSLLVSAREDLPFGLGDARDLVYCGDDRARPGDPLRRAVHHLLRRCPRACIPWSCVWPGALAATLATGIVDVAFPVYLSNDLDAADRHQRGLRADRAGLVLRAGADRARRRGDQRAAV